MFKRFIIYPFLFVLFVILSPLITNAGQIDPVNALRPLAVLLVVVTAALLLLGAIFKDWHYAGYLVFLVLLLLFTYGHIVNVLDDVLPEERADAIHLVVLAVLSLVVLALAWRKTWRRFGESNSMTPLLNSIIAIAVLSQGLLGVGELVRRRPAPDAGQDDVNSYIPETGENITLDCSISPDIYWIVLDGYGRSDVLDELYGVDTSDFLASLEEMGFTIAGQSHSNYIQTVYSIPSALEFRYVEPMPANVSGYDYFPEMIAENRLVALLRQCGYRAVAFDTGFVFTSYKDADLYFSFGEYLNELEELMLSSTPLHLLLDRLDVKPPERSYEGHRARVHYTFDKLAELPGLAGPNFAFAHIISPHPPFVFEADGTPVDPKRSYSLVDGNDYRGSWKEYQEGYAAQVQYVNRRVEETISTILERSSTPPIIIIQGDHGPGGHLEWKSPQRTCLWERSSILNAYYLPDGGAESIYSSISPVNSFRVVLNTYFGANLELLPDEVYFTSTQLGKNFINVTEVKESRKNCD